MGFNEYPYTDFHEMNLDWVIKKVKELAAAWAQVQQDWTDEQAAFANLQSWIENYFNNLNVQTEINVKLDAMVAAGTMSELIAPYVASGLPTEVAAQIGDVVAAQIGPVVAAQINAVVADQLPAVAAAAAAAEVSAWLALHVDPETGYVIDDTFTVQGAAADAKAVGDALGEINNALTPIDQYINGYDTSIDPGTKSDGYYLGITGSEITFYSDNYSSAYELSLADYIGKEITVKYDTTSTTSHRVTAVCLANDIVSNDRIDEFQMRTSETGLVFTVTSSMKKLYISFGNSASNLQIYYHASDGLKGLIGDDELETTDKTITGAINELKDAIGENKVLSGKVLAVLGDSLSTNNVWANKVAEITGLSYGESNNFSTGGTQTLNNSAHCGQLRAKMLVDSGIEPDYIIIENVNDSDYSPYGTNTDESYFNLSRVNLEVTPLSSVSEAKEYFTNNFATIISGVQAEIGKALGVPYTVSNAILLTLTHVPTSDGDMKIVLQNEGVNRYVAVTTSDSIENVIDKIVEISYTSYICEKVDASSCKFIPITTMPTSLTIQNANGITYTTSTTTGSAYVYEHFVSHDTSEWSTQAKWKTNPSLYSVYKGLIEYLQSNFKKARTYFMFPKCWNVNFSDASLYRADGTIDYDKVINEKTYGISIFTMQKAFCDYYQIPYIDVRQDACITPENMTEYMSSSNVHPKTSGYERWGESIARQLV